MAVVERSVTCMPRVKKHLIRARKSASVGSASLATEWTVKVTSNFCPFCVFFNDIVCLFVCQAKIVWCLCFFFR